MLWILNNAELVLRGPKCVKKISPTQLNNQQPEPLIQRTVYAKLLFILSSMEQLPILG